MYYVFRLQSIANPRATHISVTSHLNQKVAMHTRGEVPHTKENAPWRLTFYAAFVEESRAEAFAAWLKTEEGRAFGRKHLWHSSRGSAGEE